MKSSRSFSPRKALGLGALPLVALLFMFNPLQAATAAPPGGPPGGPPGNNGTVKIDGEEFDSHPNNEPHVGCKFQVDFYGFDEGDYNATVTFTAHPPTGNNEVLETDEVFIGEDDNSGGGSEAGLDAQQTYDLTAELVGKYPEHPQQGYHVKLTVNAPGSQGADTKHKVFWVRGCAASTTTTTGGDTTTTTGGDTTTTTAADTTTTTQRRGTTTTTTTTGNTGNTAGNTGTTATTIGNAVLGETLTNPAAQPAPGTAVEGSNVAQPAPASNLPTTGAPVGLSLLVAAIALSLGATATHFGNKKPERTQG